MNDNAHKNVELEIGNKGPVKIDFGYIYEESENIKIVCVQCETKRPVLEAWGNFSSDSGVGKPDICLGVDDNSLYYRKHKSWEMTNISFPELAGWSIISAHASKYTIFITLVKE